MCESAEGGFLVIAKTIHSESASTRDVSSLLSARQPVLVTWLKILNLFAVHSEKMPRSHKLTAKSSSFLKWPNDRMVTVTKDCRLLVQGGRDCREV